jgi:hypothetical protein
MMEHQNDPGYLRPYTRSQLSAVCEMRKFDERNPGRTIAMEVVQLLCS